MSSRVDEILDLLNQEDYSNALVKCDASVSTYMTSFMENLTVNTATDYLAIVVLYSRICALLKKPWKVFPKLEAAKGALRFLKDFIQDTEVLSETYVSFADAYAYGTYLPEAASCYAKAAEFFSDEEKAKEVLTSAFYYQARFGKEVIENIESLEKRFGSVCLETLRKSATDEADHQIVTDPVEATDAYVKIRYEIEEMTDACLSEAPSEKRQRAKLYQPE